MGGSVKFSIKFEGLDKLALELKKRENLDAVKTVVKMNGAELQAGAQQKAPVGTPESTGIPRYVGGTLKRSIGVEIKDGGLTAEVTPTAEYAAYVELGTRFMAAQPYLEPAFNIQKSIFMKDLKRLMK